MAKQAKTPVEIYKIGKTPVYVKRDDLVGDDRLTPPWGKHEAVGLLLDTMDLDIPIIHLNVYGSWSAWSLAYWADQKDFKFTMAYPNQKNFNDSNEYMDIIRSFDCDLLPLKPNVVGVLIGQTKKWADENGYQTIPYAFDTQVFADYLEQRAYETVKSLKEKEGVQIKTLVVVSGTGTTCKAMMRGFFRAGGKEVHTVAVSSEKTVFKKLEDKSGRSKVIQSPYKFSDRMEKFDPAPFPCSPFWERKGWWYIEENIKSIPGPVLFWNLGGEYPF